jgi:hypothetical protein
MTHYYSHKPKLGKATQETSTARTNVVIEYREKQRELENINAADLVKFLHAGQPLLPVGAVQHLYTGRRQYRCSQLITHLHLRTVNMYF